MTVFWDVAPCSRADSDWPFRGAYISIIRVNHRRLINFYQTARTKIREDSHLQVGFEVLTAVSTKMAVFALMMEAARTSETLENFYQTTRRYNLEDSHLSHFQTRRTWLFTKYEPFLKRSYWRLFCKMIQMHPEFVFLQTLCNCAARTRERVDELRLQCRLHVIMTK
jgi:hypothetical protein